MAEEKYEFIVSYCARFCKVEMNNTDKPPSIAYDYTYALWKFKKPWGEIVPWNNTFMCAVMATNAMEALTIFFDKKQKQEKGE